MARNKDFNEITPALPAETDVTTGTGAIFRFIEEKKLLYSPEQVSVCLSKQ